MTRQHIIVVGAGIVGAMTAFRLAADGARVTLVEAQPAPGHGVSAASFGWITCAAGDPDIPTAEYERRLQAIEDYARLDRDFAGRLCVPVRGALIWGDDERETRDWARRHAAKGSDVQLVGDKEIAVMEPLLAAPPPLAAWFPRERALDVSQACVLLVRAAREAGATVMLGERVLGVETKGARASGVRLATGVIEADGVVIAAGAHSPALVAELMPDHGVSTSPSVQVTLSAASGRLGHVIEGGGLEIRSRGASGLIAACDPGPTTDQTSLNRLGAEVRARVEEMFPGIETPRVEGVLIGHRPVLADGRPLVSAAPGLENLLLAVAHPGVILAPAISREVADLIKP